MNAQDKAFVCPRARESTNYICKRENLRISRIAVFCADNEIFIQLFLDLRPFSEIFYEKELMKLGCHRASS